ncbi:acyl-[acyl-carrier-protein] thioesterase [Treponema parvum]|uniref:Acyl-[acyl-carrier-protein] thioesterase n=1 Tax=Treponema parvum TaxID=138851 RepID=A0A975F587_9SPIR|nr:acyl-ACP thioesterase domain-containing protein [Treponema parvum]QTQ14707.1 acyl-[acyl-carrier-protein] thioesterase [Treponema parvum]
MEEFKEWFDYVKDNNGNEIPIFNREAKIYFSQCSADNKLNLYELLKLCSDSATEDYNLRGFSWKMLWENQVIILLSRQSFRFFKRPQSDERIRIVTWEETPEPLQLVRRYKILSDAEDVLITGHSTWLLVNPDTRKIIRTKDFNLRSPVPNYLVPYEGIPTGKIILPENMQELNRRPICFTDIDSNGHTNNSRYGAFTVDCLPEEYQKKDFTDFRINYSKEAVRGQTLTMFAHFDDEAKKITVAGKADHNVCFESELFYK